MSVFLDLCLFVCLYFQLYLIFVLSLQARSHNMFGTAARFMGRPSVAHNLRLCSTKKYKCLIYQGESWNSCIEELRFFRIQKILENTKSEEFFRIQNLKNSSEYRIWRIHQNTEFKEFIRIQNLNNSSEYIAQNVKENCSTQLKVKVQRESGNWAVQGKKCCTYLKLEACCVFGSYSRQRLLISIQGKKCCTQQTCSKSSLLA